VFCIKPGLCDTGEMPSPKTLHKKEVLLIC
jgi:hypothetical protein